MTKKYVIERQYIHYESVTIMASSKSQARKIALQLDEPKYVNGANWLGPFNWTSWEILDAPCGEFDDQYSPEDRGFKP